MDVNGSGKFWKMHVNRSWDVIENQFYRSLCTLIQADSL